MRDRLEALTGLRFMAAGLVVLHHTARHFRPGLVPEAEGLFGFVLRGLNDVLIAGNEAVSFFFVLSGAVLAYTYLDHTGTMRGTRSDYYWARIARIYPAYLVGLVVVAPFGWMASTAAGVPPQAVALLDLGLAQGWPQVWTRNVTFLWNSPAWSLSVEAFFYVAFPLILPVFGRVRASVLPFVLIGMLILAVRLPLLVASSICGDLTGVQCADLVSTFPPLRLPEFLVGVATGVALVRRPAWLTWLARVPRVVVADFVVGGLIVVRELPGFDDAPGKLAGVWVLLIVVCARTGAAPFLARHWMRVLGEASYSMYLLHWPLWSWYTLVLGVPEREPAGGASSVVQVAGYLVLVVGLALANWRFIETPARSFLWRHSIRRLPTFGRSSAHAQA